jgi:hypothetical protein
MKPNRVPKQVAGKILVRWAKPPEDSSPDWWATWKTPADKNTASLCVTTIQKLGDELAVRGYDISTLQFSVSRKI